MAQQSIRTVLIVGGGTAGWMSAAALAHKLAGTGTGVRLIESEEIGTIGVGEATVPHIRHFNASLGFDEADFMARTQATYKLGIEFRNWARIGDSYIHPFGAAGRPMGGVDFHHHWLRLHRAGRAEPFEHYSLPCVMARADRFAPPSGDPASPLSTYSYAYQFDALLYAAYLRAYATERGVERVEGRVVEAEQDGESGAIRSIRLADGRSFAADLFVDCSGFRGLLIEGALQAGYEEWSHWLPCDRAVAVPCERKSGAISPSTRATAQEAGWTWRIPLRHRTGNGHVYSSAFLSDDAAEAALLAQIDGAALASPRRLRFTTGKRRRQWIGNCVAIGLAAGFLEPLESTSIHLVQLAIGRLLDLFPTAAPDPLDAAEFNRLMDLEYDRIRDFLILHYCATERDDTPFWNHVRTMPLPDTLAEKMALFRERGVVAHYRDGMFLEPSWLAVYLGQRLLPRQPHPAVAGIAVDDAERTAGQWREAVQRLASQLPVHDAAAAA